MIRSTRPSAWRRLTMTAALGTLIVAGCGQNGGAAATQAPATQAPAATPAAPAAATAAPTAAPTAEPAKKTAAPANNPTPTPYYRY